MTLVVLQVEEIWFFRYHNTTLSFHYWTLEPGNRYRHDSSGQWQHGNLNYNHQLDFTGMQDDSDLLFLTLSCSFYWERTKSVAAERDCRARNHTSSSLAACLSGGSMLHIWMFLSLFLSHTDARSSSVIFESRLLNPSVQRVWRSKLVFLRGIVWFLESKGQKCLLIFCLPISK
jgi:hypothetical protein